jgi:hypothetical protein
MSYWYNSDNKINNTNNTNNTNSIFGTNYDKQLNNTNNTNNTNSIFGTNYDKQLNNTNSIFGTNSNKKIKISDEPLDKKIIDLQNKFDQMQKDIDILKYKESTRHIIHQNVICSNCQKNNITGIRFKCFTCLEYNICEDCEKYLSYIHDNSHFFIRIHDTSLYNNICQQQNKTY